VGGCAIARHFQEMSADGLQAVVLGDAGVVVEGAEKVDSSLRASHFLL
jgi:hypothetical protein